LGPEFLPALQPEIPLFGHLRPVIHKTDRSEAEQTEQGNPDVLIAQIRPE
jgi:hypothetical protein